MFFRLLIVSVFFVSSLLSIDRVAAQENSLENTSWQLKTIFGFNNTQYTPGNPSDYLLRFRLDNRPSDRGRLQPSWSNVDSRGGNDFFNRIGYNTKTLYPTLFVQPLHNEFEPD